MVVSVLSLFYVFSTLPSMLFLYGLALTGLSVMRGGVFWQTVPSLLGVLLLWCLSWFWVAAALCCVSLVFEALMNPLNARLPSLGGHSVGTLDFQFGPTKQHARVFYPSASRGKSKTAYIDRHIPQARGIAAFVKMPAIFFQHLPLVDTQTTVDAAALPGVKPLVLFSHGLGGARYPYSAFCNSLATLGWTVIAFEHQDGTASATTDAAGETVFYSRPTPAQLADNDALAMRQAQLEQRVTDVDALLHFASTSTSRAAEIARTAANVERVHLMGHSFGGATAVVAAHRAAQRGRLQSLTILDSWMHPVDTALRSRALPCPNMFLNAQLFQWPKNVAVMEQISSSGAAASCVASVPDTGHQSLSDFPGFAPLVTRMMGDTGRRSPHEALACFTAGTRAFLEWCEDDAAQRPPHFCAPLQRAVPELVIDHSNSGTQR